MRTHETYYRRKRRELSELSGISLDTLNKIFQRQTKNPKASTVQKIYDVLVAREHEVTGVSELAQQSAPLEPACI